MVLSTDGLDMGEDGTDARDDDRQSSGEDRQSPGEDQQSPGEVGQSPPAAASAPGGAATPPHPESGRGADADGFDPADHEAPFGDFEETSDRVMLIGEIGVYIGYLAIALAVLGIALGTLSIQPLARITLVISLVLVTVALLIGFFFQMVTGGFPVG